MIGKEIDLSFEFKRENLSIPTLSETKEKGQGKIEVGDEHVLIYSGVPINMRAAAGVTCLIHKDLKNAIQ